MFLHFLHAITNDRDRVTSFVFGTRLTNISRYLRHRDVDVAMGGVSDAIADWSGGTRIGMHAGIQPALVAPGAGPKRGRAGDLRRPGRRRRRRAGEEMERLHKSCRSSSG